MKKNFESVYFLRNGKVLPSHSEALESIDLNSSKVGDGEALLARYRDENDNIKTIDIKNLQVKKGDILTFESFTDSTA